MTIFVNFKAFRERIRYYGCTTSAVACISYVARTKLCECGKTCVDAEKAV
jgi:hypothetical protein